MANQLNQAGSPSPRPRKRLRYTGGNLKPQTTGEPAELRTPQTLPVAGGPDKWSLKRFELWKAGTLGDVEVKCADRHLVRANRLELSVWSEFFRGIFCGEGFKQSNKATVNIEDADSNTLEALIRALYEKEVTLTPANAQNMLALADRLQVSCILEVVERYLVSQISHENAIEALFLADKHSCMILRQAAIPLTARNFDRLGPNQLVLLTFADLKELLASDQLSIAEEHSLFTTIKRWSEGPNAGSSSAEIEEQLLLLVSEIRLEHIGPEQLNAILDDPWMQNHPKVLSAVAKALIRRNELPSSNRKNRVGKLVRFPKWSTLVKEARTTDGKPRPVYSEPVRMALHDVADLDWHIQVYPFGLSRTPNKVGIFIGARTGMTNTHKFRLTLVNQKDSKLSIAKEFTQSHQSTGGSLRFWGSPSFVSTADLTPEKGFLVDDTLLVSVMPIAILKPKLDIPTQGLSSSGEGDEQEMGSPGAAT